MIILLSCSTLLPLLWRMCSSHPATFRLDGHISVGPKGVESSGGSIWHSVPEVFMAVYSTLGGFGWLPNFGGLVLASMGSYNGDQRLILQGFSRSPRLAFLCTAQITKCKLKLLRIFAIFVGDVSNFFTDSSRSGISNFFDEIVSEFHENVQKNSQRAGLTSCFQKKKKKRIERKEKQCS